jgi:hypothetical protein
MKLKKILQINSSPSKNKENGLHPLEIKAIKITINNKKKFVVDKVTIIPHSQMLTINLKKHMGMKRMQIIISLTVTTKTTYSKRNNYQSLSSF